MEAIKKLLVYTKPYKLFVVLAPLLMALEVTMDLLQPLIMQKIIDSGIANNDFDYVLSMWLLMIGAAVIGIVGGIGCTFYSSHAAVNFATDIRRDVFKKVEHYSSENRDEFGTGKLITIATSDISAVQRALMMTLRVFVRGPLLFIGSIIIVFFQARELFPILAVIIPILLFFIILLSRKSGKWFKQVQEAMDELNMKLQESIAGIRVVKAFVRKNYEVERFKKVNDSLTKTTVTAEQIITVLMPILLLIVNSGIVAALWLGGIRVGEGTVQVGEILAFINYLNIILMALMTSSMVLMQLMRAVPSAQRIQSVLEAENKVQPAGHRREGAPVKGDIEFKNISFSYSEGGTKVLSNLSFSVKQGEKIGIIGSTGSGKTTLMKLLPRLYDVAEGEIRIGGVNVKDMDLEELRGSLAFITQRAVLFSGSIESNLTFGKSSATLEELDAASEQARADEFIKKLAEGYDYSLTQGATNLSGGQKQRLSIARAFVRKPNILILDDATSAVDARSEAAILEALNNDFQHTTTFIIASKVSSIIDADKILVMDNGELRGIGTHDELLRHCPIYQEIYHTQAQKGGVVVE